MQCQKMLRILWICAIILPALLSRNCLLKKQGHKSWNSAWPKHCQRKKNSRNWRNSRCLHCKMSLKFYSTDIITVTASTAKKYWPKRAEMFRIILDDPPIFFISILWCQLNWLLLLCTLHFVEKKFLIGLVVFFTMVIFLVSPHPLTINSEIRGCARLLGEPQGLRGKKVVFFEMEWGSNPRT